MQLVKYYYTLKYLKFSQFAYRLYYHLRKRFWHKRLSDYSVCSSKVSTSLQLIPSIPRYQSYAEDSFTFLNIPHRFTITIDWNHSGHGKLWCYNLTYFDFLNQEGISQEEGLRLIHDFIGRIDSIRDGLEPYPISLRIINWVKFLARHQIRDEQIEQALYRQALHLLNNLEYHLLGNHLLENGFALLFAAALFPEGHFSQKAEEIIRVELEEQILPDGGHFELSPMYHQIILDRLLDSINMLKSSSVLPHLLPFLRDKASIMLGWLRQITFSNEEIPLVNDAAFGIAPTTSQLLAYADRLGVPTTVRPLGSSGYRKVKKPGYEMLVDVGQIGPDYIPGHAHSDTFNFVLHVHGSPLIVDTGISTYETCERRLLERGTAAHNTVQLDRLEQSEVWGSFRVARRANVRDLVETDHSLSARHTGYERIGASHRREFRFDERMLVITDRIESQKTYLCRAYLHFHPNVRVCLEDGLISADGTQIDFSGASEVTIGDYLFAPKFNVLIPSKVVTVMFSNQLTTSISLINTNKPAWG